MTHGQTSIKTPKYSQGDIVEYAGTRVEVIKEKWVNFDREYKYLVEWDDDTRGWVGESTLVMTLDLPQTHPGRRVFEDLQIIEMEGWTHVIKDGEVVYDGDTIRQFEDVLDVLGVEYKYIYYDYQEQYYLYVGRENTRA